ncbi:MAG: hypothetical protein AAGE80_05145 [Pseudomonadota bacterium]
MSETTFELPDDFEPEADLPEVEAIENLGAATDEELEDKAREYQTKSGDLVAHHNYWVMQMIEAEGRYVQVFEKVTLLETLAATTLGVQPGIELYEELELLNVNPEVLKWVTIGGLGVSGFSLLNSIYAFYKTQRAFKSLDAGIALGTRAGATLGDDAIRNLAALKSARKWKAVGIAGAVLTLGSAGVGFLIERENAARRRAYLVSLVEEGAAWFDSITRNINSLKGAVSTINAEIQELQDVWGFETFEEMAEALKDQVTRAGETDALFKSATRMLCAGLEQGDVAQYTGLPPILVARRAGQITQNPALCDAV